MALTFSRVRRVCSRVSPSAMYLLMTGSIGPCPDTWSMLPFLMPWLNVCAGAGAPSVRMTVVSDMSILLCVVTFRVDGGRSGLGAVSTVAGDPRPHGLKGFEQVEDAFVTEHDVGHR